MVLNASLVLERLSYPLFSFVGLVSHPDTALQAGSSSYGENAAATEKVAVAPSTVETLCFPARMMALPRTQWPGWGVYKNLRLYCELWHVHRRGSCQKKAPRRKAKVDKVVRMFKSTNDGFMAQGRPGQRAP